MPTRTLKNDGLVGWMGRCTSPAYNAAIEIFFALLQKNVLNRRLRSALDQLPW